MKIKCLLIDDEPLALDILESFVQRVDDLEMVGRCENVMQAFALLQNQPVDLLFLDIQMPRLNGIEFLKSLQQPPKVIFTTAYRDYAVEAFELDVVDYLMKPIAFARFLKAVSKAYVVLQRQTPTAGLGSDNLDASNSLKPVEEGFGLQSADNLLVRADKKMIKVPLDDILYIESLKDYVIIHVSGRRIVTKQKISYLEQKLPEGRFLRIHRSFLVALPKIQAFSPSHVEIGGHELPVGRSYKSEVAKVLGLA